MNQVAGLALLGLVAVLAWPRLRSHRLILSLLYRGGQLLLIASLLAAGTAVVCPFLIQGAVLYVDEHAPQVVAQATRVTLDGLLILGSLCLLVLLAPLAAWKEWQKSQAAPRESSGAASRKTPISPDGSRNGTSAASVPAGSQSPPVREELQVILGRMKQAEVQP